MRRLEARRWVLRNTRLPSHSAKTRTVPRTQAWMRRMRLMRACRSISKDNGGTELPFSDIGSSYVAAQRWHDRGSVVEAARRWITHCGSRDSREPNSGRDVRPEAHLQRLWRFPGDLL